MAIAITAVRMRAPLLPSLWTSGGYSGARPGVTRPDS